MRAGTLVLVLMVVAITVFTVLNWGVLTTQTTLSLGIAVIQAPLGLVILGLLAFLTALFLVFVVYLQTSVLLETRRHARELQSHRELADQAEVSRFTELRGFLDTELKRQADVNAESRAAMFARVEQLESDLRTSIEESGNTLSAYFGELEDRLEKGELTPHQPT